MVSGGDEEDEGRVLSPEELDIEAREEVAAIGDDRFVVGPDGSPNVPDGDPDAAADAAAAEQPDPTAEPDAGSQPAADPEPAEPPEPEVTGRDVKEWLGEELRGHDSRYAYHIAAKYDGDVAHQQLATDDVGAAFDGLLVWYARQLSGTTAIDEALGILLGESSIQPRYPTARLVAYLEEHDLGPEDSIRDLVDTVEDDGGLAFPRRR